MIADVEERGETSIALGAQTRDVGAAAALGEPGSLGEIGAVNQRCDEPRDLAGVGRAVRVDHRDDVTGGRLESAGKSVSLALPYLPDDPHAGRSRRATADRVVEEWPSTRMTS